MLLAEPSRSQYDLNFSFAGVPVRVHPLFWLVTAIMGSGGSDGPRILIWMAAVFVSILAHELGHAVAIRAYGWPCHIVLYSMGGLAVQDAHGRRTMPMQVLISLAGPFAGFALAAVLVAGLHLSAVPIRYSVGLPYLIHVAAGPFASANLDVLLNDLLFINIYWGIVNLLPVFPLDGGQVAQAVLEHVNPREGMKQSLYLSIGTAAVIALVAFNHRETYRETYVALLFAFLAFNNYQMLQSFGGFGRSRW